MFQLVGQIFFGLVVGTIAKLVMPGKEQIGVIMAALIGLVGSTVGTLISHLVFGSVRTAGWILSLTGAIAALYIYRFLVRARAGGETATTGTSRHPF
jgi:uncharacterized membrane protein YeaQ/YmgE (transglycosylase-associated protein family)